MTRVCLALSRTRRPSGRQLLLRRRARRLTLRKAVWFVADDLFRFQFRATKATALWSDAERVWLGRETFLHWSLVDASIDIPWLVAHAIDAPEGSEQLLAAVRADLIAYWEWKSKLLPRKGKPYWMPLP